MLREKLFRLITFDNNLTDEQVVIATEWCNQAVSDYLLLVDVIKGKKVIAFNGNRLDFLRTEENEQTTDKH